MSTASSRDKQHADFLIGALANSAAKRDPPPPCREGWRHGKCRRGLWSPVRRVNCSGAERQHGARDKRLCRHGRERALFGDTHREAPTPNGWMSESHASTATRPFRQPRGDVQHSHQALPTAKRRRSAQPSGPSDSQEETFSTATRPFRQPRGDVQHSHQALPTAKRRRSAQPPGPRYKRPSEFHWAFATLSDSFTKVGGRAPWRQAYQGNIWHRLLWTVLIGRRNITFKRLLAA